MGSHVAEVTFGSVISARRKELKLNQKELAARVLKEDGSSITPQYLNDIEHDRRSPTTDHMVAALAEALDLQADYLFVLAGKVPPAEVRLAASAKPDQVNQAMVAFRRALTPGPGKP